MKFLLFGTGDYYNRYKKWFEQQEVIALLDNALQKQHTYIDEIEVLSPKEGIELSYDVIVILSFYVKQMRQQLLSLGVDKNKIYHFYDLHQLIVKNKQIRPLHYYLDAKEIIEQKENAGHKILLLSNDLALGGPSIALFHAAVILKKCGYSVVYASMLEGPLKDKIIEHDIPVVVDENLQIATMKETKWVDTFSLIICNTLNFYVFLSERNMEIPVVWWLHDGRFFYDGVNREIMGKICLHNLKTVSVGPVPIKAIKEFIPTIKCDELLYGVVDLKKEDRVQKTDKVTRFITIGFLVEIKGQDILLKAIQKLPDNIKNQSEFYLVGHNNTLLGEKICREVKDNKRIIITGSVDREKIHELFRLADVLICPSRQDPMPTVVAEAMMHAVPCIVSDVTGTTAYIHDGQDGFVFPCENECNLAEKIKWCVDNRDKLQGLGEKARKLYEKYFSMSAFEKRLLEIIQEVIK